MQLMFSFINKLGSPLRIGITAAMLSVGYAAPAMANMIDGTITKINPDNNLLTINKTKKYILPDEFDYSTIHTGQKVTVFYDTDPSGAYVSDIQVQGAKAADKADQENDALDDDDTTDMENEALTPNETGSDNQK